MSQAEFSPSPFSVEHIIPISKGGSSDLPNLALSCQGCNNHKYNRTAYHDPLNQATVELFHPRNDSWDHHFSWNNNFLKIIAKTAKGRATIHCLKLNRAGVVALRRILFLNGEHPPVIK